MSPVRLIARIIAAGSAAVAVGVSVNQTLSGGKWNWWALAVALVIAALAEALSLWLGRLDTRDEQIQPMLWPTLTRLDGSPRRLSETTPRDLGVHPNRFGFEGEALYIPRSIDAALHEALTRADRPIIVVAGPRLAGTTSALAEAAQTRLPDHRVIGFVDDSRIRLTDMIHRVRRWAEQYPGAVLWLDGLTPERFTELAVLTSDRLPDGLWVLATVDTDELDGWRIPEPQVKALEAHAVRVDLGVLTDTERVELRNQEVYADLRPVLEEGTDLLMGRLMVAWEQVRKALIPVGEESTDRIALLHAVTDWYRAGLPRLLTAETLGDVYRAYRRELAGQPPTAPVSATGYTRALEWATSPASGRPRLIELQAVADGQRYAPHPLLGVIADDESEAVRWPVQDALWAYADRFFDRDQRRDIGYTALRMGANAAARRLLDHTDTTIDPNALRQIAVWLYDISNTEAARHWCQRVVDTGHPDHAPRAMYNLGILEYKRGNVEDASHWWRQVIETGHPHETPRAMLSLGVLEREQGNVRRAHHWYRRAIDTGHPTIALEAMLDLGGLEKDQGNVRQARHWYGQAIDTGHNDIAPRAMFNFGVLEYEQGNVEEASHWWRQAIDTGHSDMALKAMVSLGALESARGNVDEIRHWCQRIIDTGHPDHAPEAMFNLAVLEYEQGNIEEASHWYRQTIDTGHGTAPKAMYNLGAMEYKQGNIEEASHWYRQTIDTGHADIAPNAMISLGALEYAQDDAVQARRWWQHAVDTGHPDDAPKAMVNLGILEMEQKNIREGRQWLQQVIDIDHPRQTPWAMVCMGVLENGQGDVVRARHWWGQAANTDQREAATRAAGLLRDLDRREHDRNRAAWFARYGSQAYADPRLMRRSHDDGDVPGRNDDNTIRDAEDDVGEEPAAQ